MARERFRLPPERGGRRHPDHGLRAERPDGRGGANYFLPTGASRTTSIPRDFSRADDVILIDGAAFGLDPGASNWHFRIGATLPGRSAPADTPTFRLTSADDTLWFEADGGSSANAQLISILPGIALSVADALVP